MKLNRFGVLLLLLIPLNAWADTGKILNPLPCGIYDENVNPLVEKDLATQAFEKAPYTMVISTKSGKNFSVEVKSVEIDMPGERNQVSVFLDGKPYAKTSHQDVPLYLEVTIDGERYRIICVRVEEPVNYPAETGKEAGVEGRQDVKNGKI